MKNISYIPQFKNALNWYCWYYLYDASANDAIPEFGLIKFKTISPLLLSLSLDLTIDKELDAYSNDKNEMKLSARVCPR